MDVHNPFVEILAICRTPAETSTDQCAIMHDGLRRCEVGQSLVYIRVNASQLPRDPALLNRRSTTHKVTCFLGCVLALQ